MYIVHFEKPATSIVIRLFLFIREETCMYRLLIVVFIHGVSIKTAFIGFEKQPEGI